LERNELNAKITTMIKTTISTMATTTSREIMLETKMTTSNGNGLNVENCRVQNMGGVDHDGHGNGELGNRWLS